MRNKVKWFIPLLGGVTVLLNVLSTTTTNTAWGWATTGASIMAWMFISVIMILILAAIQTTKGE